MKVINLGEADSVLNNIIAQMRDKTVQKDSLRFRYNLERLGHIFAYELSKVLDYSPKDVITPLATARVRTSDAKIVVSTILRAGLPLHKGILDVFDNAENAFVAAFRKYDKGDEFHINVEYCTCPDQHRHIGSADTAAHRRTGVINRESRERICSNAHILDARRHDIILNPAEKQIQKRAFKDENKNGYNNRADNRKHQ